MELLNYWPQYVRDLVEFQWIAKAEQPEFDKAAQDVRNAPQDFFLVSLSEYGCQRWERILRLSAAPGDTLETRRQRILLKYLDQLPYTYRWLLQYLASISSNFKVTLNNDAYKLFIQILLTGYPQRDALAAILRRTIPANLVLKMQTQIPQAIFRPALAVCSATVTINKHEHIPQGG